MQPTPDLLDRKPYGLDEKVPISRIMWRNIIGQSIYQVCVALNRAICILICFFQIVVLLVMIYIGAEPLGLQDMVTFILSLPPFHVIFSVFLTNPYHQIGF